MESGLRMQILCTSIVYLSYTILGITRGFLNFAQKQMIDDHTVDIDVDAASWIASLCIFPNPFGSLISGYLMDKVGRIASLKLSVIICAIGWFTLATATNRLLIYGAVSIIGLSVGMLLCSSVYVAEITEDRTRCILLSIFVIFFTSGSSFSYIVTSMFCWRTSAFIFACAVVMVLLLLILVPESPQWYAEKGFKDKAIAIIEKMRDPSTFNKENEFNRFIKTQNSKSHNEVSCAAIFDNWKPLGILILFQICLQCSGYSIWICYSNQLYTSMHLPMDPTTVSIGYSFSVFFSSFLCPFAVICWDRKSLLKYASTGMTFSLAVLLIGLNLQPSEAVAWIVSICSYLYVITCNIGSVTLSECMPSELYKNEVRGLMCGVTQAFSTVLTGSLIKIFSTVLETVGATYVFSFFTLFSFLTIPFAIFILPETKNKTLDEIQQQYFQKKQKEYTVSV